MLTRPFHVLGRNGVAGAYDFTMTPSSIWAEYVPNGTYDVTVTTAPVGGTAPHTVLWTPISGGSQITMVNANNSAVQIFRAVGSYVAKSAVYECKYTDNTGLIVVKNITIDIALGIGFDEVGGGGGGGGSGNQLQ